MILFPLALLWLAVVLIWVIRSKPADADPEGPPRGGWRRFRPRPPRRPWNDRSAAGARRRAPDRR